MLKTKFFQSGLLIGALGLLFTSILAIGNSSGELSDRGIVKTAHAETACPPPQTTSTIDILDDNNNVIASFTTADNTPVDPVIGSRDTASYTVPADTRLRYVAYTDGVEAVNRTPGSIQNSNLPVTANGNYYPTGYSLTKTSRVNGVTDILPAGTTGSIAVGGTNSCIPTTGLTNADATGGSSMVLNITVAPATWNLSCTPAVAPAIYPGGAFSFVLSTSPVTNVQYSYQISPVVGNGPQINFVPDNSVTRANLTTTASTPINDYTIKFTAQDGNGLKKDCFSKITVQPLLVVKADIKCVVAGRTDNSSCTLPTNGYVELTWTSENATACRVTPGDYTDLNRTTNLPRVSPSTSQYYTLTCYNSSGVASDRVSVIVEGTPPPPTAMSGDIDCGLDIASSAEADCVISSLDGNSITTVAWTTSDIPTGTSCAITRNDLATQFSAIPNQPGYGSTSTISGINMYKLICGTTTLDTVKITIVKSPNPPSPVTAQANNNCGVVELNWSTSNNATSYIVYQSPYTPGDSTARNWTAIKTINDPAATSFSFNPVTQNGNTFIFAVTAANADGESTKASSNMVTVNQCGVGSLDLSDIDITQVTRGKTVLSNPTQPCNNSSDVSTALVDYGLFQDGDMIDLQINACNTGTEPITSLSVDNQMINLELVGGAPVKFAKIGRVAAISSEPDIIMDTNTGNTNINNSPPPSPVVADCGRVITTSPLKIAIDSLPAKPGDSMAAVCSISFRAKVKYFPPANNPSQKAVAGSLYRFQDLAVIANSTFNKTVVTRPFLFQVVGGAPIRVEGAP